MTLENCQRLLKHFTSLADGTIPQPVGHKDWDLVVAQAKVNAKRMEERIAHKLTLPKYAIPVPEKPVQKEPEKPKEEVKKSGKK